MARCKDCIHDKVCNEWAVTSGIPFVNSETCEHFMPTADVVPKSEVDILEFEYARLKDIHEHSETLRSETLISCAREIFAKVRKACYEVGSEINNQLMKAIRKDDHYQIELLSGAESAIHAMRRIFAEYEKEYTEGANDGK